jgi:hypothetical protein
MHSGQLVDTVEAVEGAAGTEGVAAGLGCMENNLSHAHGSDSPGVDLGRVGRDFDHNRSHDHVEPVVVVDSRCRAAAGSVERMDHSQEANAR